MSAGVSAPILEVHDLTKRYGALTALSSVNLSIFPGEIFALLGPNGAGKTTLIGTLCGLVRKTSGTLRLFGTDLDKDPIGPRFQVGVVPQEINFDPFFTVAESLRIQLGYYGQKADPARIHEVLAALDLADKADAPTRALSGGMKRRLLIAKALVHKPKLVFLDEPTAGVDVELRRDLWNYVRKLRAEGTTVILTTHYLEEAEELADRIGVIDKGRLLLVEEKASLMARLGERRLELTLRERAPLPEALAGKVEVSEDGTRWVYVERPGARPIPEILEAIYRAGLPVAEVETRRSRLEEILIQILHGGAEVAA
jgi:ABC-2 type transport system ATP-binding protein